MNKPNVVIRFSQDADRSYLKTWLNDKEVLKWFPMESEDEIEDAVGIWMEYAKKKATLTAIIDNIPVGMANLYVNACPKLAHQALFGIIVDARYRGKGIGTEIIHHLIRLAKERFHLEILHLEVYEGNPAKKLYEKLGFTEFGVYEHFIKENGTYLSKIFMQKEI
ncbi:MAG: GNAT family N-acetyltransferase [Parachlamydiales bacterium]|nr:GNAT family N-acetyltransferase [Parachlamydiales bacterium]